MPASANIRCDLSLASPSRRPPYRALSGGLHVGLGESLRSDQRVYPLVEDVWAVVLRGGEVRGVRSSCRAPPPPPPSSRGVHTGEVDGSAVLEELSVTGIQVRSSSTSPSPERSAIVCAKTSTS